MKKLFDSIRKNDILAVKELIESNKDLINCISKNGLSRDDGQSPLQVAIKTNNIDIANYLLDVGADVNFIEKESKNKWKAPIIHDTLRTAIANTRWNTYNGNLKVFHSKDESDKAFNLLKRIIELGADVNAHDSYNNSCLDRVLLDCKQILPYYDIEKDLLSNDRIITEEIKDDVSRIIKILIDNGANINEKNINSNKSFKDSVNNCVLSKCLTFDINKKGDEKNERI